MAGHRLDPGGELGDGEAARRGGQGERCRQGGADPGLVQVDAAGAGGAEPGWQRELIEGAIGDEADIGAVEGGGEPLGHAGQAGDDDRELLQRPAAAQLPGVVHGRLQAQDVFAFGVGLQLQEPEADPAPGQAVLRFLDHDFLRGGPAARLRCGRVFSPNIVRSNGMSSRDRVRSSIRSNSSCICPPEANSRLRLYSAW